MKIRFVTLGCKLNFAESSALGRSLLASGHTRAEDGEQADICVLNTCTVTDAADHKCRQALSRLRRENPNAVIIVTGCYAQLTAELPKPKGLEDADYVLGNECCGLRNYSADDAIWSQLTDAEGEAIQDIITEYIRQRTLENGAVTPADFDWHWQIVCHTETGELPAFKGTVGAKLAALPENGNRYVIYNEAQGCMLTARPTDGGLGTAACPAAGAVLPAPLPEDAVVFTAHAMADGSYQFTDAGGNYLVSGAKGSLTIQPMPQDESLSRWRLEPAYGGWYLVNAGAAGQSAIQYYSGRFTMYHLAKSGSYIFNVYEVQ